MPGPSPSDAAYLFVMLVLLPLAAFRSAKLIRPKPATPGEPAPPPRVSRQRILLSTLVSLAMIFLLSFTAAAQRGADLFWLPRLGARELLAGAVTLAAMLGVMVAARRLRTAAQRRTMGIHAWMPRTSSDWGLYVATTIFAGIAEESAYRGVLVWILAPLFGSWWLAALFSALLFAIVHVVQGWRSMLTIFAIALLLQALVSFTDTLVVAMVVHTVYDLIAGRIASQRLKRLQAEDPAAAAAASGC